MHSPQYYTTIESLAEPAKTRIVYYVADGIGGLTHPERGYSELQAARLPNLDDLAARSSVGLCEPVGPGITPGSGPGHLGLFGYDPVGIQIGRGVLSALGVNFKLLPGDLAARVNFCTLDADGLVVDRRAGRIDDETGQRVVSKVLDGLRVDFDGEIHFIAEKEHRAALVLRGGDLVAEIGDTDPQTTGVAPHYPRALVPAAAHTADVISHLIRDVKRILADEDRANGILLRGVDEYRPIPSLNERFKLRPLSIASYPMYRGLSRLVGMDLHPRTTDMESEIRALESSWSDRYDYYFVHYKKSDSSGEDGDFDAKVAALEEFDSYLPRVLELSPDVVVVTGDHSTPSVLAAHSWHPVPTILAAKTAFVDPVKKFDEGSCLGGALGIRPLVDLMPLALAHAGRLKKFGA